MRLVKGVLAGVAAGLLLGACQAAAPPTAPPTPAVTSSLIVYGDTVQGGTNLTDEEKAAGLTCVQKNRFAKNEDIVWRFRVIDPATGQAMDDQALSSVVIKLPDQDIEMAYGGHPHSAPVDYFWSGAFDVPVSYPSGALSYTVVATAKDGRTGTFNQFGVAAAQLTITDEVRPVIAE